MQKKYEFAVKLIENKHINKIPYIKPFEMYDTVCAQNAREGMVRIIREDKELGYTVLKIIHINKSLKGIPVEKILDENFQIPPFTVMKDFS